MNIKPYKFTKANNKRKRTKFLRNLSKQKNTLSFNKKATRNVVGVICVTILVFTIILIPTLIVMIPTSQPATQENVIEVLEEEEQIEVPQLKVSVERTDSGEIEEIPLEDYVA